MMNLKRLLEHAINARTAFNELDEDLKAQLYRKLNVLQAMRGSADIYDYNLLYHLLSDSETVVITTHEFWCGDDDYRTIEMPLRILNLDNDEEMIHAYVEHQEQQRLEREAKKAAEAQLMAELERERRRKQWLELKAEFEE